jgi:hypothetical protein
LTISPNVAPLGIFTLSPCPARLEGRNGPGRRRKKVNARQPRKLTTRQPADSGSAASRPTISSRERHHLHRARKVE